MPMPINIPNRRENPKLSDRINLGQERSFTVLLYVLQQLAAHFVVELFVGLISGEAEPMT